MSVRAKFYVSKLEEYPARRRAPTRRARISSSGGSYTSVGLKPVMPKYNDATPSGDISLSIKNSGAAEFFKAHLGKEVYVDFVAVDDEAK